MADIIGSVTDSVTTSATKKKKPSKSAKKYANIIGTFLPPNLGDEGILGVVDERQRQLRRRRGLTSTAISSGLLDPNATLKRPSLLG